ncbi:MULTISPECIES: NAD(P)H-dependent oxidoreductase [unclassified Gilliamella]|uniref:NAD(P)H-dependent oxidoreductase n=1 Tax=unclassified Gilliamella TaxID=2685620 RepID=UPI00132A6B1F|nr:MULTISPECIES: NAD(P)H-dependent oxidoreductase [unclassified Gilliamella]MWN32748.1 flavodoxin family protein [Gilliamella sp. Pra-s60]MWP30218.1 flavodoxin family protein [Gilliamella sp. Pra-s54]MWP47591.1 flavodoxin family protein [Gilliamella sp. Pas-s27]
MKTLIIYSHPYEKSYNHAILERTVSLLKESGKDFDIIDLYKDGFNPIYTPEELRLYSTGQTTDPLVEKYQKMITDASDIVFIFPIWWYDLPAILKGFIDKVFKKNFSYIDTPTGIKGKINHINSTTVLTTSDAPTWFIRFFAGNSIKSVFINSTLKQLGIKNVTWKNMGQIKNASQEKRQLFLKKIKF